MRNLILAIDDSPERYETLAKKLHRHGLSLICMQHPTSVQMALDTGKVGTILLDHDMPTYAYDDQEGRVVTTDTYNGQYFARTLVERRRLDLPAGIQVLITSANPAGAKAIATILSEADYPHHVMSVFESCPEERWLGAILDRFYD